MRNYLISNDSEEDAWMDSLHSALLLFFTIIATRLHSYCLDSYTQKIFCHTLSFPVFGYLPLNAAILESTYSLGWGNWVVATGYYHRGLLIQCQTLMRDMEFMMAAGVQWCVWWWLVDISVYYDMTSPCVLEIQNRWAIVEKIQPLWKYLTIFCGKIPILPLKQQLTWHLKHHCSIKESLQQLSPCYMSMLLLKTHFSLL